MGTYSSYFKGSTTLAECMSSTSVSPLITSELTRLSSATAPENPIHTLRHAFPLSGVFDLESVHKTTETELPALATAIAQFSQLNVTTHIIGLGHFSQIGHVPETRTGPYWSRFPVHQTSQRESTWKTLGAITTNDYLLAKPRATKD